MTKLRLEEGQAIRTVIDDRKGAEILKDAIDTLYRGPIPDGIILKYSRGGTQLLFQTEGYIYLDSFEVGCIAGSVVVIAAPKFEALERTIYELVNVSFPTRSEVMYYERQKTV